MGNQRPVPPSRDSQGRTEPVLGDLDRLEAQPDRTDERAPPSFSADVSGRVRRAAAPRTRRRARWPLVVAAVIVVLGGSWVWTHHAALSALLPRTQLNSLLTRGNQALAAGKLSGGPDSARALFEAARALDPDSEQALAGLQKVGNAQLQRARAALQRGDLAAARSALEEARSLLGGGPGVNEVDQAIARAVLRGANIDILIGQGRAALAAGRIEGSDGAATLFGKVLQGDPGNAVARHGMDQVGGALAARLQAQLQQNDRAGAHKTLDELAGLLPHYAQLPALQAAVAQADKQAETQRDQYLANGEADLRAGKITGNGDDNALAQFKAALAADPGNAQAEAGLGQVAQALIVQANAAIDAGQTGAAKALLDQAAALAPKSADLAAARSRLASGGVHAAAGAALPVAPVLTPVESAKVARLVQRARLAARRGDIMLPPGDSAYDLYRSALAIDGNNAAALAGLRSLATLTRQQFAQALQNGNLQHADDMLATLEQLDPGDAAALQMRHQLGSAWLDRADHDATLGRAADARSALAEARRLVPDDPRIGEVNARIGQSTVQP